MRDAREPPSDAAWRPGAHPVRPLAQSAFVDEDDDPALRVAFFNGWPHLALPAQGVRLVALACPAGGPLRTPTKGHQQLPDMAWMIADAKLALDQVSDSGTGPERSFITQLLGAFHQQHLQPFTILLVQFRLAPGATGLLQAGLTFVLILAHPAGHGLRNDTDLASDSGLGLAPLP
jgi:hypothetical protein